MTEPTRSSALPSGTAQVACSRCGTVTPDPGLTWMSERDPRRGLVWYCDRCARSHLRSIEAKLEQEYW